MSKRYMFAAALGLSISACSSWDHHNRIRRTCDVLSVSMDTAFDHLNSTPTNPLTLADNDKEYKWTYTDWSDPNQGVSDTADIIGNDFNGEPALGGSKWIKPKPILVDDGNNGYYETYSDYYFYSFCYGSHRNDQNPDFEVTGAPGVVELELKSNAIINRVLHNENTFLPFPYPAQPNPYSNFAYDNATMSQTVVSTQDVGANCFNVHLIRPNGSNPLIPLILSATGTIRYASCLRTDY